MDGKLLGNQFPKPVPKQLSAFETDSLNVQAALQTQKIAIPREGQRCPQCQSASVKYDSMLNLVCPDCSYSAAGCFT